MVPPTISIHALLAESDHRGQNPAPRTGTDFYPRSPCGERPTPVFITSDTIMISIHALLAESDFTISAHCFDGWISIHALLAESDLDVTIIGRTWDISIHALLAESDIRFAGAASAPDKFLSTLSLRRATRPSSKTARHFPYFYPRSPCGERLRCTHRPECRVI